MNEPTTPPETEPVVHSTFTLERHYPVPVARVYEAFADAAVKRRWFAESEGFGVHEFTMDFRVGGREVGRFQVSENGMEVRNDTVYLDIVPERRIVFAYTMSHPTGPFSASLSTVELSETEGGTRLRLTEQGAFMEHSDGAELRSSGWGSLLDSLGEELAA